jgi:predicted RNA binding protein YcfA (HicA-like mRNA interferase family)
LRLPRDLSGLEFAKLLSRYGYEVTRQAGSHIRLTSAFRGSQHHITVPAHKSLKLGTLIGILSEVATYLEMGRAEVERDLFGS